MKISKKNSVLMAMGLSFLVASSVQAIGFAQFNPYGTGKPQPVEPVRADVSCQLKLVAAKVDYSSTQGMDKYTFEGDCVLPVSTYEQARALAQASPGKAVTLPSATLRVRVESEWFEKMHRASERVTIISSDWVKKFPALATPFSTWATCDQDPFINKMAACHSQGLGGDQYAPFVDLKDVPFGRGKTSKSQAQMLSPAVAAPAPSKTIVIVPERR